MTIVSISPRQYASLCLTFGSLVDKRLQVMRVVVFVFNHTALIFDNSSLFNLLASRSWRLDKFWVWWLYFEVLSARELHPISLIGHRHGAFNYVLVLNLSFNRD